VIHHHFSSSALSENQLQKLLKRIQHFNKNILDIQTQYVHFSSFIDTPSNESLTLLDSLLTYGEYKKHPKHADYKFIVIPRFGTLSPWASKATDIAKRCNLDVNKIERGIVFHLIPLNNCSISKEQLEQIASVCMDRMTETVVYNLKDAEKLFTENSPKSLNEIDILQKGRDELVNYNQKNGLALSEEEIQYLTDYFFKIKKNPTDAELMMFAQANSEHCRHKIFNAKWIIDNKQQEDSLFGMIRNTHQKNPHKTVVAYSDNSSIIEGKEIARFYPSQNNVYKAHIEKTHYLMKVETHNHPTAISPFPGAATGSGGEIRDEGATGRGSKPKAGLTGFSVSNLNIPELKYPWEKKPSKPAHISSPLNIMMEGPIGGAAYNNEFGRPNIAGYFRVYEQEVNGKKYGYHKPIMLAGGVGNISDEHTHKKTLNENVLLVQLGGPGMLIGLGGGAASSMNSGSNEEDLDYASVQRGNPEIQRRAQEVIDRCWQLKKSNPILSIHDVGAGGLSNAFPELINDGGVGAEFDIRKIQTEEKGMAPHELWCNESQERYVLAINEDSLDTFNAICERERCPYSIVGKATNKKHLLVKDSLLGKNVVDMDLNILLGKPPKTEKNIKTPSFKSLPESANFDLVPTAKLVISHPSVASKKFLIHIGDRSVTGLIAQDQMVGPWQTPVSNVAVTKLSFESQYGEAFAVGERSPLAVIDAKKSARMAVGESITNILSAYIGDLRNIKLSANWMAASGDNEEDFKLFEAVKSIGIELCPALGISIPVGKDSMSMKTSWDNESVTSPLSLVITAFSECQNVCKTLTPVLEISDDFSMLYIDLGLNQYRTGGSIAEQVTNQTTAVAPDLDNPDLLINFSDAIQHLIEAGLINAYHDRSDGGLFATLCEMAFASRSGLDIDLSEISCEFNRILFAEELGAIIQVNKDNQQQIIDLFKSKGIQDIFYIGKTNKSQEIRIKHHDEVFVDSRANLEALWSQNSFHIQSLRDNSELAKEELETIFNDNDPGIKESLSFKLDFPNIHHRSKQKIAVLREQGVNGHYEMAAAFHYAGFESIDVHMQDLLSGHFNLSDVRAFVACGGFSYGDVLGAGEGWSKVILNNPTLKEQFIRFFKKNNTIALGVCNGCQMLSNLKSIIPGTEFWPKFVKNTSDQFESRVVSVKIPKTNSIFFKDMAGSVIPVITAHGEGRASFEKSEDLNKLSQMEQITLQYVTNEHKETSSFPFNPNGSSKGVTGFSNDDGRFNIMMPHPERAFRKDQHTWSKDKSGEYGPWFKMFTNALYFLNNS